MKSIPELLNSIEKKIPELKSLDPTFSVFGAQDHEYKFNHIITENDVVEFEKKYETTLPESYRAFILKFGNGGCGPNYGLLKLNSGIYELPHAPDESEIINLSNQFKFTSFWNLEDFPSEDDQLWEKEYQDLKWIDGMLRICHQGCGTYINLVLTGKERGNIWVDDRANDGGIYPIDYHNGKEKTSFIEWYLNWLSDSIEKIRS